MLQHVRGTAKILAACQHIMYLAGVVFVPAKTPVKLEATDDGLDVWIAAVNPQAFQGQFRDLRSLLRMSSVFKGELRSRIVQ